jgi:hypothetical protein
MSLKTKLKKNMVREVEILGEVVKVKLLSTKAKSEFLQRMIDAAKGGDAKEYIDVVCSGVLYYETSKPIFDYKYFSESISDEDASIIVRAFMKANGLKTEGDKTSPEESEKN